MGIKDLDSGELVAFVTHPVNFLSETWIVPSHHSKLEKNELSYLRREVVAQVWKKLTCLEDSSCLDYKMSQDLSRTLLKLFCPQSLVFALAVFQHQVQHEVTPQEYRQWEVRSLQEVLWFRTTQTFVTNVSSLLEEQGLKKNAVLTTLCKMLALSVLQIPDWVELDEDTCWSIDQRPIYSRYQQEASYSNHNEHIEVYFAEHPLMQYSLHQT